MMRRSERLVRALATERQKGSTACAELALDALYAFLDEDPDGDASAFAQQLAKLKPDMAVLAHIAWQIKEARSPGERIQALKRAQQNALQKVAEHAAQTLPSGGHVLTFSFSGTVLHALLYLAQHKQLYVTSALSLPGGEGALLADELATHAIPAVVVDDNQALEALKASDTIWVGADSITEKLFVNKVGTRQLLLAARSIGIPAYVLCDEMKQLPPSHTLLQPSDPLFETVPRDLAYWISEKKGPPVSD